MSQAAMSVQAHEEQPVNFFLCCEGHGENNSSVFPGVVHVHCLLPHMGLFRVCLCPCVSRQDILNYFAQLPP